MRNLRKTEKNSITLLGVVILLVILGVVFKTLPSDGFSNISFSELRIGNQDDVISPVYSSGRGDNLTAEYFIGSGAYLTDLSYGAEVIQNGLQIIQFFNSYYSCNFKQWFIS